MLYFSKMWKILLVYPNSKYVNCKKFQQNPNFKFERIIVVDRRFFKTMLTMLFDTLKNISHRLCHKIKIVKIGAVCSVVWCFNS